MGFFSMWMRLKEYALTGSISKGLISGKEVPSSSPDKTSMDGAGPGVWAEREAGLLGEGSESPF